jgi:hypothetical protein
MYENGKMKHVETVSGMWEEGIQENDEGDELNYDIV